MRVNKLSKLFLSIVLFFTTQFINVEKAVANDTLNLGQRILPVCLVYLTPGGAIFNIWSNVSQIDDLYVIKFLNEENVEMPLSGNLFSQYISEAKKDIVERDKTEITQFVTDSNSLEEIRTIV